MDAPPTRGGGRARDLLSAYYNLDEADNIEPTVPVPPASDAGPQQSQDSYQHQSYQSRQGYHQQSHQGQQGYSKYDPPSWGGGSVSSTNDGTDFGRNATEPEYDFENLKFNSQKWFNKYIHDRSIPKLVVLSNELHTEIKNLDSELQMLVYENYSKFIRATDTISLMNGSVKSDIVPKHLTSLDQSIRTIDSIINESLEQKITPGNSRITTLLQKKSVVNKIQTILSTPKMLRLALRKKDYARAAEIYCKTIPLVKQKKEKYPRFQTVSNEIDAIMVELRTELQKRLKAMDCITTNKAIHSSLTLLELGEESVVDVYLQGRLIALDKVLDTCLTVQKGTSDEDVLGRASQLLTERYIPMLVEVVRGLRQLASRENEEEFVRSQLETLAKQILRLVSDYPTACNIIKDNFSTLRTSLKSLSEFFPDMFEGLLNNFFIDGVMITASKSFEIAQTQLVSHLCELHGAINTPHGTINTSGNDVGSSSMIESSKDADQSNTETGAGGNAADSSGSAVNDSTCSDDTLEKISSLEHAMLLHGCLSLTECQPLYNLLLEYNIKGTKFVETMVRLTQDFFQVFIEACRLYSKHIGQRDNTNDFAILIPSDVKRIRALSWHPLFALALVRIGRHLEVRGIQKIWSVGADLFSNTSEFAANHALVQVLSQNCKQVAADTLQRCVEMTGARISEIVRTSTFATDWMDQSIPDPVAPRTVTTIILKELREYDTQVGTILGDPRKPESLSWRGMRQGIFWRPDDDASGDVERLLARSTQVYGPIAFNRANVVAGVLKIILRGFSEYIRQVDEYSEKAVLQLQLDVFYLSEMVNKEFVATEDSTIVEGLFKELLASVTGRARTVTLLEPHVVEKLLNDFKVMSERK